MRLKLLLVALAALWSSTTAHNSNNIDGHDLDHGHCPYGGGWHELDFICYRESFGSADFEEAQHVCIDDDLDHGGNIQLMPVGKLRNFVNRYTRDNSMPADYDEVHEHHHSHHGYFRDRYGPFRVNAIKGEDHIWREWPSGYQVLFHHFPQFNPDWGNTGDTLIWHPGSDELRVVDRRSEYTALCYRAKHDICRRCQGFYRGDHECNDAGYCINGNCHCDEHFGGEYCDEEPADMHYVLMHVGGDHVDSGDRGNGTVQIYDLRTNTACFGPDLPTFLYEPIGTFTNDQAVVCGGEDVWEDNARDNKNCWALDKELQTWFPVQSLEITMHAGDAINFHHGHDMWAVGGHDYTEVGTRTFVFTRQGHWEEGPDLPRSRYGACVAQINECEFAVIGGSPNREDADPGDFYTMIDIYNVETDTWRCAHVAMPEEIGAKVDCDTVTDFVTGHSLVVIAGGEPDYPKVIVWDTDAERVYEVEDPQGAAGGGNGGMQVVAISRHDALLVGGYGVWKSDLHKFSRTMGNGTTLSGTLLKNGDYGVSMMVPRDYVRCVDDPSLPELHPDDD